MSRRPPLRPLAVLGVLLAGLALAPPARGQGLGDAATREKQKRGTKPPPAKVYTNQDLKPEKGADEAQPAAGDAAGAAPAGSGSAAAPAGGSGAVASRPADPVERERHERSLLEAEWRMRFANAREELANAEAAAWTDAYRVDFVGGQPVQVRTREQVETAELKRARAAMAELEEDFRKTGLPAGWARQ